MKTPQRKAEDAMKTPWEVWVLYALTALVVAGAATLVVRAMTEPDCLEYGEVRYYVKIGDVMLPVRDCLKREEP